MSYEPEGYGDEGYERGAGSAAARSKVSTPAILLIVVGILNVLGGLYYAASGVNAMMNPQAAMQGVNPEQARQMEQAGVTPEQMVQWVSIGFIVLAVIAILCGGLAILAGVRMRNLESHGLAVFASILTLIPCISPLACCVLGEVAGIWALVVLMSQDVRSAFR
jgi:hypothetical protein